jgi:radical SAM protein with 4Fe4S-binding SPASM domain
VSNRIRGQRFDKMVRMINRWANDKPSGIGRYTAKFFDILIRGAWHVVRNRRYITIRKLINMGMVNLDYYRRSEWVHGMPYVIKVEPTNLCNTQCRLCPTGRGFRGRSKGMMELDKFRQVIDKIRTYAYVVDLSNWGDPLIVKDIYHMIRYTHDAGIWTYISSNLHAFDVADAETMVRSGLDMLNCSLHGASQSTYEAYQPGKQFDAVIEKVRAIQAAKVKLRSLTPAVQLFFVVTKYNEHEIDAFRSLAESLNCEALFSSASLNLRFVGVDKDLKDSGMSKAAKDAEIQAIKAEWLPVNRHWVAPWYGGEKTKTGKNRGIKQYSCDWPWRNTVINWDGSVSMCCGDFDPRFAVGNVFAQSLTDIWNNESYRAARRSFVKSENNSGKIGEPCRSCSGVLE